MANRKKCYLCEGTEFNKRPGSVRDRPELEILACASCGLVFLSSFDHIRDGFYESSEMHGEEVPDPETVLKETAWDDELRSLSCTEVYGCCQLKQQKHQRPPLKNVPEWIVRAGFESIPITAEHAQLAGAWDISHRDPFDRMLAAQAKLEKMPLATVDILLKDFPVKIFIGEKT